MLSQQQQQQQQAGIKQRYAMISLAEGVLLLMDMLRMVWHGKRLVGKTLAPAVLPATKLSLALLKACGASSSSSGGSSSSARRPGDVVGCVYPGADHAEHGTGQHRLCGSSSSRPQAHRAAAVVTGKHWPKVLCQVC
jgi:hypothetical protein